jgi:hypothetical protein
MKHSIRTKISIGLAFLFLIILVLSVFSAYYLNRLSNKTNAILKENYLSVVYAREMAEGLTSINQEILNSFLMNKNSDSVFIGNKLALCSNILESAKNNITEAGEEELVMDIETEFAGYRDSISKISDSSKSIVNLQFFQNKFGTLYQKLGLLSQMNGEAIEIKTEDAKAFSKKATTQMTILGTVSFLIALSFIYSFGTYYNDRIYQLYKGIKEIVSSNYNQRLNFEGKDEFYEISLAFNEMAEQLEKNEPKLASAFFEEKEPAQSLTLLAELKNSLLRLKSEEQRAIEIISQLENK